MPLIEVTENDFLNPDLVCQVRSVENPGNADGWLTVVYTADGQSKRYKEDPLTVARKLGFNAR